MKLKKPKVHDFVGKMGRPVILYILEESTKSAFPIAFGNSKGKGWIVPTDFASEMTKCLAALTTKVDNPRMKVISNAEQSFALRTQGYRETLSNENWTLWFCFKNMMKWYFIKLYWKAMKDCRLVEYALRGEAKCIKAAAERIKPRKK